MSLKCLCGSTTARAIGFAWLLLLSVAGASAQTLAPGVNLVTVGPAYQVLNTSSFGRHALVTSGSTQYIAFYGVSTNVTVGRRTLGTTNWTLAPTALKPNSSTDGHCVVSIGIGSDGILHCSWGMHGNPFHYARSFQPWSLTLVATNMTGAESSVTYPQFLHCPNGDVLYLFREGGSGNGDTYLNRWSSTTHTWTNVHTTGGAQSPFIYASGAGGATNANAYPNFERFDSKTNLHLTWCWREDASTIESNHEQNYARTPDYGQTWTKWDGTPYVLPITKSTAEIIWPIPTNSTLMNQAGMTLDTNERPVICTWWAPGGAGTPIQLMLISNDGTRWFTNQIGQRTTTQWINRPIIVCDRSNNLFTVFCDPERANKPTLGWCVSTNRARWNFADLTSETLGGWEPQYDPVLWERDQKLHLYYQYIGGSVPVTAKVLEFDPAVFLANLPSVPLSFVWTNANGNWSTAANWSGTAAPPAGGSNNLSLTFGGAAAYSATNNLPGPFSLNQLSLTSSGTGTNSLAGNPLLFTNNATSLPGLAQNSGAAFSLANSLTLGADLAVALNTASAVSFNGEVAGRGGLAIAGTGQLVLSASNSFTGPITLVSGTLVFGANSLGSGALTASGGTLRWLPGTTLDLSAGRQVTLNGAVTFDPNGNLVSLTNGLGGSGAPTLNGAGTLVLAGSNSYNGLTTISTGTLVAAHPNALGTLANYTTAAGGFVTSALGLQGNITLAEALRCGGRQPLPNASGLAAHLINLGGTNTLTGDITAETGGNQYNLESAAGRLILAGNYSQVGGTGPRYLNLQGVADANLTGAINNGTGIIYLTKRGAGRWTLSGTNTFTGETIVSEGALWVNGSLGTNTVTIQAGATLGGNGVIRGPVTLQGGATLAPGAALGALSISNTLSLAAGSITRVELDGSGACDQVVGLSHVTYGGTLSVSNLSGPLTTNHTFQLFRAAGSSGNFTNIVGSPGFGLAYAFSPASGVLSVVSDVVNPTANPDFLTTMWNVPVTLTPLTNDTDPGGFPLAIVNVSPTNGTAVISNAATNVLFTPVQGYARPAYVGYTITNTHGGSASSVVTVAVTAPPQPTVQIVMVDGSNLILCATNGAPNGTCFVLASTNLALAITNWTPVLTNTFDTKGNFSLTNAVGQGSPEAFFLLKQ